MSQAAASVINAAIKAGARSATKYISPKLTVKATRRHKISKRDTRVEFVVTIGAPNYRESNKIKAALKEGKKFPLREIELRFAPKRK